MNDHLTLLLPRHWPLHYGATVVYFVVGYYEVKSHLSVLNQNFHKVLGLATLWGYRVVDKKNKLFKNLMDKKKTYCCVYKISLRL